MTSNPLVIVGVMIALGLAMNFIRFWTFVSGGAANRAGRMSRIADSDAHLPFDERIAERMRELERDKHNGDSAARVPASPPAGFGRRVV